MPLGILIALVVGGIIGIALLTRALGFGDECRLTSESAARAAFLREFPEVEIHAVTRCADCRAALMETSRGPAIVWAMGADTTARLLGQARLTETETGLDIHLPDITAPRIRLRLSPEERRAWTQLIGFRA
ncbi:hypothetical protein SAMN05421759_101218 [Roseivivax lentus]|uniref:Uncharacterized protein n=1 Tax=Roseivivax lentus TaxID=633194 RepID=A0A1N7JTL3_9RHOB|nr:hypothetical protein [Roseivivax lentus]SIS52702.1 hypothetical protein SAMN05421759_101218 [Roseivivax lentus]